MDSIAFPHTDISLKIVLAIGLGLLVGLEREFASKDVGVRTFSLTSLMGLGTYLIGSSFALAGFVGILCLAVFMNLRAVMTNRSLEITTSVALFVTFFLGCLVALGHVFSPVTIAILMTMLLAWKKELAAFAHGLQLSEIRSAVMIGLLTFVIYPLLPSHTVDPWGLVNPQEAWVTVIVLAGISFVNYVLLKVYSTKGLYYSALLGGAVNSSAAVTEISGAIKLPNGDVFPHAFAILLMVTISMLIRNFLILGIFEPRTIVVAGFPLIGMISVATFLVWRARTKKEEGVTPIKPLKVSSPISLKRVLSFAVIFILLQAAGTLAVRYFGSAGVLIISFLGGFVSSASTTAAAAKLASQGQISASIAGASVILTSISSAFVNLPLVYQITRNKSVTSKLAGATIFCTLVGLALMSIGILLN